jgi:hypothetical protein
LLCAAELRKIDELLANRAVEDGNVGTLPHRCRTGSLAAWAPELAGAAARSDATGGPGHGPALTARRSAALAESPTRSGRAGGPFENRTDGLKSPVGIGLACGEPQRPAEAPVPEPEDHHRDGSCRQEPANSVGTPPLWATDRIPVTWTGDNVA